MKKIFQLMALAFAVMALGACSDFLDEYSQDEFEPKTTTAFDELLMGEGYNFAFHMGEVLEIMSDDAANVDDMIKKAFEKAVAECKYQAGL